MAWAYFTRDAEGRARDVRISRERRAVQREGEIEQEVSEDGYDKTLLFTPEARTRFLKAQEARTPEGRLAALEAENVKLRERIEKLEIR